MNKTIILGVGSPFADDQAGWMVARQLSASADCQKKIISGKLQVELLERPWLNLLNWLQTDYKQIFLIDMVKTNLASTGNIYVLKGDDIIGCSGMLSSHSLSISDSLGLAKALGIDISRVIFFGIEGENYTLDKSISLQIEETVIKVTNLIAQHLGF